MGNRSWKAISSVCRQVIKTNQRSSVSQRPDSKLEQRSLLHRTKNLFRDYKIKQVMDAGAEIMESVAPLLEKPTIPKAIRAAFVIGKTLSQESMLYAHDFFDGEEWVEAFDRNFNGALLKVIFRYPYEVIKTSSEGYIIRIHSIEGGRVGYMVNTRLGDKVDNIFVFAAGLDAVRAAIKRDLWKEYQGKSLLLRRSDKFTSFTTNEDKLTFEVDRTFQPLPSQMADEYSAYLKRCIDAGVHRSVMFYGPPGTGKSTLARSIVERLEYRSFRVRIEDVGGIDNSLIFQAIEIFEPDVLIFDDFDRSGGQDSLLEALEHLHSQVKLVIATVNNRRNLDKALLRPGRFDEIVPVKKLDDSVVKNVLGEHVDAFETVKDWPIVYVHEYVKRCKFMDKESVVNSIQELAQRVADLDTYEDDSDDDLARVLKAHRKKKRGKDENEEELMAILESKQKLALSQDDS